MNTRSLAYGVAVLALLALLLASCAAHATLPCNPTAFLSDDFTSANTNLYDYNSWNATMHGYVSQNDYHVAINGNRVLMTGNSTGDLRAIHAVNGSGSVWFHCKVLSGTFTGSGFSWYIDLYFNTGTYVSWQGQDTFCRGRYNGGPTVSGNANLSQSVWTDIDMDIDFGADTATLYANGVLLGAPNPVGIDPAATSVDSIACRSYKNAVANGNTVYLDEFSIGTKNIGGPSTPGRPDTAMLCQWSPVTFTWAASSAGCSGLAGYYVQVGTSPGSADIADLWVGNTNSYQFTGVRGVAYYCRVYARDNAGGQSNWSATGTSAANLPPPSLQVDGQPFFPLGWFCSTGGSTVESNRQLLSEQQAQGMNTVLYCYGNWACDSCQTTMLEASAILGMKTILEINRSAVEELPGYPLEMIDQQVDLYKDYPALIGWNLMDEPELWGVSVAQLQARYAQVKGRDPDHAISVVHSANVDWRPSRADPYLDAEPPPYTDVLMTDTYACMAGTAEFASALWNTASVTQYHVERALAKGKQAFINVVQTHEGWGLRMPTYAEQRYLSYSPIIFGARGLLYWMYNGGYNTEEQKANVVGPIAREIRSLIPAIQSNSPVLCVTSDRDTDTTGHQIPDVAYIFGEDARGGYLMAVNNTANTLSVTFHLTSDRLETKYGTQSVSVPVVFESRNVTAQYTGNSAMRTLTDTFSPYDVNVYRIYKLADNVSIDLGSPDVADGISHPQGVDGDTIAVANMGGVNCKRNSQPGASPSDSYFYFAVNDDFAFQGSKPSVNVTIRYYDSSPGSLELQYDAAGSPSKSAGSVVLTGTNAWMTHTFYLPDAYFGNRQDNGADFRVFGGVGNTFHLDLISVEPYAGTTALMGQAKKLQDGTGVAFLTIPVTAGTDQMAGDFYVEEPTRANGIRVRRLQPIGVVAQDSWVNLQGTLDTMDSGERIVKDALVSWIVPPGPAPGPLAIANRILGGGDFYYLAGPPQQGQRGVLDASGLSNIGLLVTTYGYVTPNDATSFHIADGSNVSVKVVLPSGVSVPAEDSYVAVTGISSCEKVGEELHRLLRVRSQADIAPLLGGN